MYFFSCFLYDVLCVFCDPAQASAQQLRTAAAAPLLSSTATNGMVNTHTMGKIRFLRGESSIGEATATEGIII